MPALSRRGCAILNSQASAFWYPCSFRTVHSPFWIGHAWVVPAWPRARRVVPSRASPSALGLLQPRLSLATWTQTWFEEPKPPISQSFQSNVAERISAPDDLRRQIHGRPRVEARPTRSATETRIRQTLP